LADDEVPSGGKPQDAARTPKTPKAARQRSPSNPPKDFDDAEPTRGAGAAGVGGGTLIAIIASALPDGIGKTILIWLAPAATLTLSAIWGWCSKRIVEYLNERDAETTSRRARVAIEQALNNPNLTQAQRAELEAQRVELDLMIVEQRMAKAMFYAKK
jgi:hypothetical protein